MHIKMKTIYCLTTLAVSLSVVPSAYAQQGNITPPSGALPAPIAQAPANANPAWQGQLDERAERQEFREEAQRIRTEHEQLEAEHDVLKTQCMNAKGQDRSTCHEQWEALRQKREVLHERMKGLREKMEAERHESMRQNFASRGDDQPGAWRAQHPVGGQQPAAPINAPPQPQGAATPPTSLPPVTP